MFKKRQQITLYAILIFFLYHTFRDYFQNAGISLGIFTDFVHNYSPSIAQQNYRRFFQDTFLETIILCLAGYLLGRKAFGKLGYVLIGLVLLFIIGRGYGYVFIR